ncbi:MAG: cache domain-containing protein, partial [Ignavibacteriaceae bacterium]|nr:cache domain-containing protein [Ignavibacteriaceae bacterium]
MESKQSSKKLHYIKILLPTFITISLFITALFVIIIPRFENIIIDRKREMIRELTSTTVSMIDKWYRLETAGEVSRNEAQESAINQIKSLRYGSEQKDYFWITDMQPKMIVHPYRPDLDGKDLNTFEDSHHKKLFVEMVNVVKQHGDGFVDYTWQWKDDSTNIVPKLSYVKEFKPWDWVIGTGIYIEDVHEEIALLEQKILTISIVISILSALLLLYIAFQNLRSEKLRQHAENELRESREKYKMLVETSGEGIIMILENQQTFINKTLYSLLGYNEISQPLGLDDIFVNYPESKIFDFLSFKKINDDPTVVEQFETQFTKCNGDLLNVLLIISPISLMNNNGIILGVKDISLNKEIKEELDYSREKYLTLTNQLTIGVFRTTPDKNLLFKEVNPAAVNLLGAQNMEQLLSTSLLKFFEHSGDEESFVSELLENKFLKNRIVQFKNLN